MKKNTIITIILCAFYVLVTPQSLFAMKTNTEEYTICKASKEGNLDKIKNLLKEGADINELDILKQWSPLLHAITCGHVEIVKFLLAKGALLIDHDLVSQDFAYNALFYAIQYDRISMVEYILKEDINTEIPLYSLKVLMNDTQSKPIQKILEQEYELRKEIKLQEKRKRLLSHNKLNFENFLETPKPMIQALKNETIEENKLLKIEQFMQNITEIKQHRRKLTSLKKEQKNLKKHFGRRKITI